MRLRILAVSTALTLLCGCDVLDSDSRPFAEPRHYVHSFSSGPDVCVPGPENGWTNCSQIAIFCPDGDAEYMVSDIVHRARYGIEGNRLTLRVNDNPETRSRIFFRVSADGETLTEPGSDRVWARTREHEAGLTEFVCT